MQKRDYYEILSVSKNANGDEIKKSYRKVALEFHPDRNSSPEAESKFKEASEAYEILSDSQKRAIYDQYGHAGLSQGGMGAGFNNMEDIFSSFGDIFEDFFGFGFNSRKRGPRKGQDLKVEMQIDFLEAYLGAEKEINITRHEVCKECDGKGHPAGVKPKTCPTCRGQGQVVRSQGFFAISSPCERCHGSGQIIDQHCDECRGQGLVRATKRIKVKVPAGIDSNMRLRLSGEGHGGESGAAYGDLYVFIFVKDHEKFKRQGDDIVVFEEMSMVQAALGGEIIIATPDGEEKLKIPAGTDTGDVLKVVHKGMKRLNGKGQGDLLVTVVCRTPKNLNKEQLELLEKFESLNQNKGSFRNNPKKKKSIFG